MTADNVTPGPGGHRVTVRSFDDVEGYEQSMRLATSSLVVREAPNFAGWHTRIDLGLVRLNSAEYSASISSRSTVRWPRFFFLTGNGNPAQVSGRAFEHGEMTFMAEHGDVSMVSNKHMAWTSIEFAPELLATDFACLNGEGIDLAHGTTFVPGDSADWARLKDACRHMLRLGLSDPAAFDDPAAARAAAGMLIEAVTGNLDHTADVPDRAAYGRHHLILRRMIDAIERDEPSELTLASLCRAANVTVRTLHLVSMEYLGLAPGDYLRMRRLRRVRQMLAEAAPNTLTVATAMTRHGLWDVDGAIEAYRALFGQTPGETLNKAGRGPVTAGSKRAQRRGSIHGGVIPAIVAS
jgi:AraC-like DNA-binding protein